MRGVPNTACVATEVELEELPELDELLLESLDWLELEEDDELLDEDVRLEFAGASVLSIIMGPASMIASAREAALPSSKKPTI